ncbi:MAG: CvpA family protein, partial [Oscillospiraceae bacterium]
MAFNLGGFSFDPETGEYRKAPNAGGPNPPRAKKPPKSKGKRMFISILITLVFGLIYYYFELPALNIHSGSLYAFIVMLCVVYCVCELVTSGFSATSPRDYVSHLRKKTAIPFYIICACALVVLVGTLIGWKVFRARDYANLISVENGDFASEVAEISFDQIPMLDKDSANVLANRKLGELSDLVSQFVVYGDSYQINYQNRPVRVTYLNYGDFFKWWGNQKDGIPAYMVVDMVTQDVSVKRIDQGIRYSPSEYFFRDLNRHLRMKYPTKMFTDVNFEINEDGQPYWVATVITPKIGLFGGMDAIGAILMDAVTGECTYYDVADVPTWVDRVFNADMLLSQYDSHGLYQSGFLNSLFGQSGCTKTTAGYNYIAQDDDVWVYTGITSVSADQGNIGFILVNQRTKEAKYYSCAGAEELSAMTSAQGALQQYSYAATFPLLLNIGGQPTYFIPMKDASGLVKMYAMVNVQQSQIVATGNSVGDCTVNYKELLLENGFIDESVVIVPDTTSTKTGTIAELRYAVIEGNTRCFIRLDGDDTFWWVSAASDPAVIILNVGDKVTMTYEDVEGDLLPAV